MVRGCATAVTAVAGRYQCAEMQRIALGRGRAVPIADQPCVQAFLPIAFIGLPWPKNSAGIREPDMSGGAERAHDGTVRDRDFRIALQAGFVLAVEFAATGGGCEELADLRDQLLAYFGAFRAGVE